MEADGGSGTALSHWEESVFANELMTGWYNSGQTNPISRITVASLADLGYEVNMDAAESYTVTTSSVAASTASSNAYNFFGSASGTSWQDRHRNRVRAKPETRQSDFAAGSSAATTSWRGISD